MNRYVILLQFTEQGVKNLKQSTARAAVFRKTVEKAGARVEAQYWTTGGYDGVIVLDAQDESKALQCLAALAAAGNVRTQTLRAFDAAEFKAIAGK